MKQQKGGLKRIISASKHSTLGFKFAWINEAAFRQEAVAFCILFPAAFWLGSSLVEIILLVSTCFFVLITEILNSAIEAVVDRIGTERHPLAGSAKDLGSAAVFTSIALLIFTWAMIAYDRFM